jgi:peptide subunit release factor RF-3
MLLVVIIMLIVGAVGWWSTRMMKKRMEKRLGREVRGEHELTSITSWMEVESKNKK